MKFGPFFFLNRLVANKTIPTIKAIINTLKAKDLADSIHPHPTLSETIMETAEAFYGAAIHIYKPTSREGR